MIPLPSQRVLRELGITPSAADPATPIARAFVALEALLTAYAATVHDLDRLQADLAARHGHPRIRLPTAPGQPPLYATDLGTIARFVSPSPTVRRFRVRLRRRRRLWHQRAAAAGLPDLEARETRLAQEASEITAHLLIAPTQSSPDLALKLAVLIAAGEAGPADAAAFPWSQLRILLADLIALTQRHPPRP